MALSRLHSLLPEEKKTRSPSPKGYQMPVAPQLAVGHCVRLLSSGLGFLSV